MKAYRAKYIKQNGEARDILFVKIKDLPQTFIETKLKGKSKPKTLNPESELVWDLEKQDFRIINLKTIIGEIKELDTDKDLI